MTVEQLRTTLLLLNLNFKFAFVYHSLRPRTRQLSKLRVVQVESGGHQLLPPLPVMSYLYWTEEVDVSVTKGDEQTTKVEKR